MRIRIRPTIPADLDAFDAGPLPHRIRALTAVMPAEPSTSGVRDGFASETVLGVGGIGYRPDGTVIAFVQMTDEARRYPAAIHRAGLMAMAMIRESRVPMVVAEAQDGNPAAERWLLRLGFRPIAIAGRTAFVWRR